MNCLKIVLNVTMATGSGEGCETHSKSPCSHSFSLSLTRFIHSVRVNESNDPHTHTARLTRTSMYKHALPLYYIHIYTEHGTWIFITILMKEQLQVHGFQGEILALQEIRMVRCSDSDRFVSN